MIRALPLLLLGGCHRQIGQVGWMELGIIGAFTVFIGVIWLIDLSKGDQ